MTPEESVEIIRENAMILLDAIEHFEELDPSQQNNEVLLKWIIIILEKYAEFQWNTADMITDLSKKYDFNLHLLDSKENPTPPQINLDVPPFDYNFFMGLDL